MLNHHKDPSTKVNLTYASRATYHNSNGLFALGLVMGVMGIWFLITRCCSMLAKCGTKITNVDLKAASHLKRESDL